MIFKKIIYFDNAATSHFKPKCVVRAFNKCLKISANPGRSGHKLSLQNSQVVYSARETVSKHFGLLEPENVIFTKNCTEALNIALLGLAKKGGNVITSCFEHNSVLRPLTFLQDKGDISLTIISPNNTGFITAEDVLRAIKPNTYMVCIGAISNVTGNANDIYNIAKICKQKNILFLVDGAQSCGHIKYNLANENGISFLTFAGHKGFLSPQGIGGLCINSKTLPSPLMHGGTGTNSIELTQPENLPEKLESGTLQTPLIASLSSGVSYVEKHFNRHNKKVESLTKYLIEELQKINKVKLYTLKNSCYGVVSFNILGFNSSEVSDYLDEKYNIATRSGLHCAPLTHKYLGTVESGTVRVSINFKNTKKEIKTFINAIKALVK